MYTCKYAQAHTVNATQTLWIFVFCPLVCMFSLTLKLQSFILFYSLGKTTQPARLILHVLLTSRESLLCGTDFNFVVLLEFTKWNWYTSIATGFILDTKLHPSLPACVSHGSIQGDQPKHIAAALMVISSLIASPTFTRGSYWFVKVCVAGTCGQSNLLQATSQQNWVNGLLDLLLLSLFVHCVYTTVLPPSIYQVQST